MFTKKSVLIGGGGKTGISLKRIFSWIRQYFGCQSSNSDIGIQSLSLDFPPSLYAEICGGLCAYVYANDHKHSHVSCRNDSHRFAGTNLSNAKVSSVYCTLTVRQSPIGTLDSYLF